jgi:threonyl-tRNA synthetase
MKPMNCPFHNLIYKSRGRSYRELPLRLFEFGTVYRYEKSGVLHGITRARGFTQDDAHIYCTKEQMVGELDSLLTFVLNLLRDYGLNEFYLELSTKNEEKFVGEDADWAEATDALRKAATAQNLELVLDEGGAAFYGPKISVQAKDAIGRTWQMSTIQVDFQLPQRFELEYSASDGTRQRPVMIHRALFGSIRAELDASDDRMQKKVRNAQLQKIPFMVIAGEEDQKAGAVSFRYRNGEQKNGIPIADAIAEIKKVVAERTQV